MIIVLTGQKRTGKSTAAEYLKSKGFKSIALADEFKPHLAYSISRLGIRQFSYQDANGETNFDREEKLFSKRDMIKILQYSYEGILPSDSNYYWVFSFIEEYITNDPREKYSFRELMQICGTDIGCNEISEMIWVSKVIDKIVNSPEENFIISDCRQNHELNTFRKLGFKVVHIKRDTSELVEPDLHITEKPLDIKGNDIVIYNNSTKEDFYKNLSFIIEE